MNFDNKRIDPKKTRRIIIIVIVIIALWGGFLFFGNKVYLNTRSSIAAQPDAQFYEVNGRPVMAAVINNFKASYVSRDHTIYGSDYQYAVAIDLETGKQLWKLELNAKDNNNKDMGGALLLGQSEKYLFFLRNQLYVINKQTGEVVAGNDYFNTIKAYMSKEQVINYTDHTNYAFDDSLHSVLIKGTNGLYYNIDGITLKAAAASISDPNVLFESIAKFKHQYDDYITDVYDNGKRCLALLDDKDTLQLDQTYDAFTFQNKSQSIRRTLYSCSSDGKSDWKKLNPGIFLFGGLLTDPVGVFHQPIDSLVSRKPYQGLVARYHQIHLPLMLSNGGFVIMHKQSTAQQSPILFTSVGNDGKTLWTVNTDLATAPLIQLDASHQNLFVIGNQKNGSDIDLKKVLCINLVSGATHQYIIE